MDDKTVLSRINGLVDEEHKLRQQLTRGEISGTFSPGGRGEPGLLLVSVRDDGCGGAEPGAGTGLSGLRERVSVVDGTLTLSSPPGGPTLIHVEIPCRFE